MVANTALLFIQITILFRDSLLGKLENFHFRKALFIKISLSVTGVYPHTQKRHMMLTELKIDL